VYPRRLISRITPRNVAVAALCFLAGAWPLVRYNIVQDFKTFRGNVRYSTARLSDKWQVLAASLDGGVLFNYVVSELPAPVAGRPRNAIERLSVGVNEMSGIRRYGFLAGALAVALVLLPLIRRTPEFRAALFALVFLAATWIQMAVVEDGGTGAHHTVLLWPFPHFLAGTVLAAAAARLKQSGVPALALTVALVVESSLLVTNQYLANFVRYGPGPVWTEAIHNLSDYLERAGPGRVFIMDWGMRDALRALGQGSLPLQNGSDPVGDDDVNAAEQKSIRWMLKLDKAVFVGHTPDYRLYPEFVRRMDAEAGKAGYQREMLRIVSDRLGRPIFEVYRYVPAAAPRS
jgi:hypothetical protein